MNKKLIALASAAILLCSTSAFAKDNRKADNKQCPATAQCDKNGACQNGICTDQCNPKKGKKDGRKDNRKADKQRADRQKKNGAMNPFAGLNLTEQQTTALKAVPTPREVMQAARKNPSTTDNPRAIARTVRADYLKNVKNILTPQQYLQFLENNYTNQMSAQPGGMKGHKNKQNAKRQGKDNSQRQQAYRNSK